MKMFWPCSFPLDIFDKIGINNFEKKKNNRIFVSCEKKIGSVEDIDSHYKLNDRSQNLVKMLITFL